MSASVDLEVSHGAQPRVALVEICGALSGASMIVQTVAMEVITTGIARLIALVMMDAHAAATTPRPSKSLLHASLNFLHSSCYQSDCLHLQDTLY